MIKNNKLKLLIASLVIILPMVIGLIFRDKLPDRMATHWGLDGSADGYSSSAFAVVGTPLIMLAVYWICIFASLKDPKNRGQNKKALGMILWLFPALSLFFNGMIYCAALGIDINANLLLPLILGLMFIVIGNYLPKCKQNFTLGIKIKWTLQSEANWNATHRFSGKIWVICGFIMLLLGFLPEKVMIAAIFVVIIPAVVIPFIYSYLYYRKQVSAGEDFSETAELRYPKYVKVISTVLVTAILIAVAVLMFTGDVEFTYGETAFTVDSIYWNDLTVEYAAIDSLEYRESFDRGIRTNGFGSARLLLGIFENDEFGSYNLYSYTGTEPAVIIKSGGKVLAIGDTQDLTAKEIYEKLTEFIKN